MLITFAKSPSSPVAALREVTVMEGQRRLVRYFRPHRLKRQHRLVAMVLGLVLVTGRDIAKERTAGAIRIVAILFRVSTMYVLPVREDEIGMAACYYLNESA